ncbi:hypothetical protein [Nocardia australiensis]|uniref:hypothetical protein n=1 Tax=Nocardia australiensis TaxID=2887191 RepID=UPI001D144B3A|nr:hypothetical protein [Nocardia australiensis]
MRFAISYRTPFNGTDPDRLAEFAAHFERCGFEGLYVRDHIALYPVRVTAPVNCRRRISTRSTALVSSPRARGGFCSVRGTAWI